MGAARPVRPATAPGVRVLDRLGDSCLPDRPAVRSGLCAERAEEFLDMERDPIGPLEHRDRHVSRGREPRVEDQGRDKGGLDLG